MALGITDLMTAVREDLASSGRSRQTLGSEEPVWGTLEELGLIAATYFDTAEAQGLQFTSTEVTDTGTPAGVVAEGGVKPLGTAVGHVPHSLVKTGARSEFSTESMLGADGLAGAVVRVLRRQIGMAYEAQVAAAVAASTPTAVVNSDLVAGVASAQGTLIGRGARPQVLIVGPISYGRLVADLAGSAGLVTPSGESAIRVLGSEVYVNAAAADLVYVADSSAVLNVAHKSGLVVDAATSTGAANDNKITLVAEAFLLPVVTAAEGIVQITAAATRSTATAKK